MGQEIPSIGVGISIFFAFLRWLYPSVPGPIAWAGVIAGGFLILMGAIMPQVSLTPFSIGLFLVGCLCIGGAIYISVPQPKRIDGTNGITIAVDCRDERLPKTFGPNSEVRVLHLFPTPLANGGRGLAVQFNHSGKDWKWPDEDKMFPPAAYLCVVTNYSAIPVFDFEMGLELEFYEAVSVPNQPNAKTAGALKLKRDWLIDIAKIDSGPSNSFSFYLLNNHEDQIVHVLLPKTATTRALGSPDKQSVSLTTPHLGGTTPLFLGPRFKNMPQAANSVSMPANPVPSLESGLHKFLVESLTKARDELLAIKKDDLSCEALHRWQDSASAATRLAHANSIGIHNPITQHTGSCQGFTDKELIDAIRSKIVALLDQGIRAANEASW